MTRAMILQLAAWRHFSFSMLLEITTVLVLQLIAFIFNWLIAFCRYPQNPKTPFHVEMINLK
jgi:hypothetical protein